jgi:DNA-binding NarL/FixJ family response regulator
VVLLAASLTSREMFQAIRLGVKGIVLKDMPARLLLSCIRQVARGGSWLEHVSARGALERLVSREDAFEKVERFLTARELEVFRLVLKGDSNRQIAISLAVSEGTIKAHLHKVFQKLGIKRRAELFVYARSAQLI